MKRKHDSTVARIRRPCGALAGLAAFLFFLAAPVLPHLHGHLHADAGDAQHTCAITLLERGQMLSDAAPMLPAPAVAAQFSPLPALHPVWVATLFSRARVFEHAPPALS